MKKILAMMLALMMVVALFAGCTNEPAATEPTKATEPTEATEPSTEIAPTEETDPTEATEEVNAIPTTVMTHDEFVAAELESGVLIETYVQTIESWYNGACHIYALSEDGGYYIYSYQCTEDEAKALVPGTKIRVSGYKAEWSGEVEIIDASIEILEGTAPTFVAKDVTDLIGTDALADEMNNLVSFYGTIAPSKDADGNEVAFLYKWDGSGSKGDDIYFNIAVGDQVINCSINAYMIGTDSESYTYTVLESLDIGEEIAVEGFLYWYENAQPHITTIITSG